MIRINLTNQEAWGASINSKPTPITELTRKKIRIWIGCSKGLQQLMYHIPLSVNKFMEHVCYHPDATTDQVKDACIMMWENKEKLPREQ